MHYEDFHQLSSIFIHFGVRYEAIYDENNQKPTLLVSTDTISQNPTKSHFQNQLPQIFKDDGIEVFSGNIFVKLGLIGWER